MSKAFTLLELMVASLLLSMLVTVLTMIFNQSSIAWRTGVASVAELGDARCQLGTFREICDDLLPYAKDQDLQYRVVSPWQATGDGLRPRAFEAVNWDRAPVISLDDARTGREKAVQGAGAGQNASLFTVGVRSAGPDRRFDTDDDVTTWPEVE